MFFQAKSPPHRQPEGRRQEHLPVGQHQQAILPHAREHHIPLHTSVHSGPKNGHQAARRRRFGGETLQTDGQVRGEHVRLARRPFVRHASVPDRSGLLSQEGQILGPRTERGGLQERIASLL